jgi:predicted RecA/RadA family phage recombinase
MSQKVEIFIATDVTTSDLAQKGLEVCVAVLFLEAGTSSTLVLPRCFVECTEYIVV